MSRENFFTAEEIRKLRRVTLDELRELTGDLDSLLRRLREPAEAGAAAERLGRIFHTIGGSAALVGFEGISDAGCELESLMEDSIRKKSFDPGTIDRIADLAGNLKRQIAEKETAEG
ncbi:MAG: Hpt domain-containing protein [bacterium]